MRNIKILTAKYILIVSIWQLPIYIHAKNKLNIQKPIIKKEFLLDYYNSPNSSSSLFISSRILLNNLEDFLIPKTQDQALWKNIISLLINLWINNHLSTFNHEIYGHGFRIRSLGGTVNSYKFNWLDDGGSTHYYAWYSKDAFDTKLLTTIGGVESNQILAKELLLHHFEYRNLDFRTYLLFLKVFLDFPDYVLSTANAQKKDNMQGNDMTDYVNEINSKYSDNSISLNSLSNSLVSLLFNPVWAIIVYALSKEVSFTLPYIKYNNIAYLPLIRPGLTPFGIAYYIENYIGYKEKTFLFGIYGGKSPLDNIHGGISFKTRNFCIYKKYSLDIATNLWCQPTLCLTQFKDSNNRNSWGALIGIYNNFNINSYFSLRVGLLYKTLGFLEGVKAEGGFTLQFGISIP